MKLIECDTLVSIEGVVYKLSKEDYEYFKKEIPKRRKEYWSDLLHWVEKAGKVICHVESYNF